MKHNCLEQLVFTRFTHDCKTFRSIRLFVFTVLRDLPVTVTFQICIGQFVFSVVRDILGMFALGGGGVSVFAQEGILVSMK